MSGNVVLVSERNVARREALCRMLARRKVPFVEASDMFQALAAVGRADFRMLIVSEGTPNTLRGLCRLARKRHRGIRILVILKEGSHPDQVKAAVGTQIDVASPDIMPDNLLKRVESAFHAADVDDEKISTSALQIDVERALAEATDPLTPDVEPEEDVAGSPTLEGALDGAAGAALLMSLFAQEASGHLSVSEGPAEGRLYFARGHPVWTELAGGDARLRAQLEQDGLLERNAVSDVAEGQLLSELAGRGIVSGEALHAVMHRQMREHVMALVTQASGNYRFVFDEEFAASVPLLRVNPFGVVLESKRRMISPDRLLVLASEMQPKYLVPGPGLRFAAPRLAGFTRGLSVDSLIDGISTVGAFYDATKLDLLMGALVTLVLLDSRLATLSDVPHPLSASQAKLSDFAPPASWDGGDVPEIGSEPDVVAPADAGSDTGDLLALYFRLKPLVDPSAVLGVAVAAERSAVEAAYWQRMKELDRCRSPDALATFRTQEIRRKLTQAYQQLMGSKPMERDNRTE